jgi:hypothetical protein
MYVTLLDFFENDLAVVELPDAVHPDNIDAHRQLVDAIEQGHVPELEWAIRRHDGHRLRLASWPDHAHEAIVAYEAHVYRGLAARPRTEAEWARSGLALVDRLEAAATTLARPG